jgi:hypothetical protein
MAAVSLFGAASAGSAAPKTGISKAKVESNLTLRMSFPSCSAWNQFVFFRLKMVQASRKRL